MEPASTPERDPPTYRISLIDEFGLVTVKFSDKMLLNFEQDAINYLTSQTLKLEVVSTNFVMQPLTGFEWEPVKFNEDEM